MKQHTVPQNIMSVEFKIFGDLTVRQFIYITIAGGMAFILYLTVLPGILKYPLIILLIIGGLLITFAKVNERPFDLWINNFITAVMMPTQRIWMKSKDIPSFFAEGEEIQQSSKKQPKDDRYQKVMSYIHSKNLPTDDVYRSNTVLDIEEIRMLTNIDKLMKQSTSPFPPLNNPIGGVAPLSALPQDISSVTQPISPQIAPPIQQLVLPIDPSAPYIPPVKNDEEEEPVTPADRAISTDDVKRIDDLLSSDFFSQSKTEEKPEPEEHKTLEGPLADIAIAAMQTSIPNQNAPNIRPVSENIVPRPQITPDVQIIPEAQLLGSEKPAPEKKDADGVFTIEPNTVIRLDDLKNLTSTAEEIDGELKSINNQQPLPKANVSIPPGVTSTLPPITPREVPVSPPSTTQQLGGNGARSDLANLMEENRLLKEQLEQMKDKEPEPELPSLIRDETRLFGHMPDFVKFPNVISGVVVDSNEKLLEDVVVILKDKSTKRIMRALKTNILGQFYSRNPLISGTYIIEANREGKLFEVATVELKGQPVDPVVIRPKQFESVQNGQSFNLLSK